MSNWQLLLSRCFIVLKFVEFSSEGRFLNFNFHVVDVPRVSNFADVLLVLILFVKL